MRKDRNGNFQPTVCDAAKELGVTGKTINEWIKKGIIPNPPTMTFGTTTLNIYPREYMDNAKRLLEKFSEEKKREKR